MNKILLLFIFTLSLSSFSFAQVAIQDFEATLADGWAATPSIPLCTMSPDTWNIVMTIGNSPNDINPSGGVQFFGVRDVTGDCNNNEGDFETLTFGDIDVSLEGDLVFSFDYNVFGFDSNDDIKYELFFDNVGQGEVLVVDGFSNFSTNGWVTETANVPAAINTVSVVISVAQNGDGDWGGIDNVSLTAPVTTTSVQFATTSATVNETDGTYNLLISITNPDAGAATTGDVVINTGDGTDIDGFTTASFSFPMGSTADETVVITITDDAIMESTEDIILEITNVDGGNGAVVGTNNLFTLSILDDDTPPSPLVISEIMYNTPTAEGTDDEWIEICNTSASPIDINGYDVLVVGTSTATFTFTAMLEVPANGCITASLGDGGGVAYNDDCIFTPDADISGGGDNNLTNSSRTIVLQDASDALVDEVAYSSADGANGNGSSFILPDLALDNSNTNLNWIESSNAGGSPGVAGDGGCTNVTTMVQFAATSAIVNETDGTYNLLISITNPDAGAATTGDVIINTGDGTDIDGFTTASFSFPMGSTADETVVITITDDAIMEPTEDIIFEITNVMGGNGAVVGTNNLFTLSILDDDTPPSPLVISEIMYNTPFAQGTDDEWIEICNTSASPIDVNNYDILVVGTSTSTFTFTAVLEVPANGCITASLGDGGGVAYNDDCIFTPDADISGGGDNNLTNSSRTIVLQDASDALVDEVAYSSADGANGNGFSFILPDLALENSNTSVNWIESSNLGGSPGVAGDGGCPNLPITLTTFNGKYTNHQVHLNWLTASESNNDYFSIQRSTNNKDFVEIGKQMGQGTSQSEKAYSFIDAAPATGLNYYRLEQVDFNGTSTFSETIIIEVTNKDGMTIYPTVADDVLTIEFGQTVDKVQTVEVFDVTGKLVQTYRVETGLSKTTLDITTLNSGVYFLKIENGDSLKFLKQ